MFWWSCVNNLCIIGAGVPPGFCSSHNVFIPVRLSWNKYHKYYSISSCSPSTSALILNLNPNSNTTRSLSSSSLLRLCPQVYCEPDRHCAPMPSVVAWLPCVGDAPSSGWCWWLGLGSGWHDGANSALIRCRTGDAGGGLLQRKSNREMIVVLGTPSADGAM